MFFKSSFRFTVKLRRRYENSPYAPCPNTCTVSPSIKIPHQSGTLVAMMNPHWQHDHPRSTVYLRAPSWCCMIYGFRQRHYGTYPSSQYQSCLFFFGTLKILVGLPLLHVLLQPCRPLDFLLSPQVCRFPECRKLESDTVQTFQNGLFHLFCI